MHKTTSQQFVVIYLASATTSEVLLLNAEMTDADPVCFLPQRKIMNIASITISTLFICAPIAKARTSAFIAAPCAMSSSGRP